MQHCSKLLSNIFRIYLQQNLYLNLINVNVLPGGPLMDSLNSNENFSAFRLEIELILSRLQTVLPDLTQQCQSQYLNTDLNYFWKYTGFNSPKLFVISLKTKAA